MPDCFRDETDRCRPLGWQPYDPASGNYHACNAPSLESQFPPPDSPAATGRLIWMPDPLNERAAAGIHGTCCGLSRWSVHWTDAEEMRRGVNIGNR